MVTYQRETIFGVVDEIAPLLDMHYEELTLNKDRIKLDPMWDRYAALEAAGAFVVFTARRDGTLIGYSAFFVNQHIHYQALTVASNDILFLHPDYRVGRTGIGLIRFCERELSGMYQGMKLTWHAKFSNGLEGILSRMGYGREEVVMAKLF